MANIRKMARAVYTACKVPFKMAEGNFIFYIVAIEDACLRSHKETIGFHVFFALLYLNPAASI